MASTKISIVGTEGTGKTVFLAVLAKALTSVNSFPRITGENLSTHRYTAEIMDLIESGKWPPSTPVDVKRELKWQWFDRDGDPHELGTFDCAGQDFRTIFEVEDDAELNDKQRALKAEFHSCDLVLLLLNLQDALDIYRKPGKSIARIELEYAPSAAIRKLREAGITLYAIFTQSDLYEERIRRDWNGDYSAALRDVLPNLYNTLTHAGSQYAVVRAVETELVDGEVVPKTEENHADLGDVIRAVDDFFAKRKEDARRAEEAVKEAAAQEKKRAEEAIREKAEAEKRAKRKQILLWFFLILFLVVMSTGTIFGLMKYIAIQEHERIAEFSEKIKNNAVFRILGLDIDMQPIPAGSFMMGSPKDEPGRENNETQHPVTISKPYWLGKYEVTQGQWEAVMGNNPSEFKRWFGRSKDMPVESVSWNDAKAFCDKLTERERAVGRLPEGYVYTLPTEAEWEYACRAGTETPFNTGKNLTTEQANYDGDVPYNGNAKGKFLKTTTKVGTFAPNAWGLYDMHGNVEEYCRDWYVKDYSSGSAIDPVGPDRGDKRVERGGSWLFSAGGCRSAGRDSGTIDTNYSSVGFRLALSSVGVSRAAPAPPAR